MINHSISMRVQVSRIAAVGLLLLLIVTAPARVMAATFTVRNTNESGIGSLRLAIQKANATAEADVIAFNIAGSGVHTITVSSQLPAITAPVTINGYSQSGAQLNTKAVGTNAVLLIQLQFNGSLPAPAGIIISAADCLVKGLVINGFSAGIVISGIAATNNVVQGCFLGTDSTGTVAAANTVGVEIKSAAHDNTIGGTVRAKRNLISGNSNGISISGSATASNHVDNNIIGTKADGVTRLGNQGIGVLISDGASGNTIGGIFGESNTIAYNGSDGVRVQSSNSINNMIRGNSIHLNGKLGINLVSSSDPADGVTPNDNLDSDSGPNRLQNRPIITAATVSTGSTPVTTITVSFNTTPSEPFTIDFYRSPSPDPSGSGEGKRYLATRILSSQFNGNISFDLVLQGSLEGQYITATATHNVDSQTGETSEFSNTRKVVLSGSAGSVTEAKGSTLSGRGESVFVQ